MSKNNLISEKSTFDTPLKCPNKKVLKSWIDYNGHMNVAFYTLVVDKSLDYFLEEYLGIGETYAKKNHFGPFVVQANFTYLNEMKLNERFFVQCSLINYDLKKMHLFLEIISQKNKIVMAYSEQLLVNVNLIKRISEDYPDWALKRLKILKNNHKKIKFPNNIGISIKIKKPIF